MKNYNGGLIMDRNQAKEFYPFLQAFAKGEAIECRTKPSAVKGTSVPNNWTEMTEIEFWNNTEYRIKPEPKYRPFKDAKECWAEMLKHQPIGWVKRKGNEHYSLITDVDDIKYGISLNERSGFDMNYVWVNYTFADCTPFGVKV